MARNAISAGSDTLAAERRAETMNAPHSQIISRRKPSACISIAETGMMTISPME